MDMEKKTYIRPVTTMLDIEPICADTMVVSIIGSTDNPDDMGAKQTSCNFDDWTGYTAWADMEDDSIEE